MADFFFPEELDFPDDSIPPLATAIGQVAIAWGSVENLLNLAIAAIFKSGGKLHAEKGEVPVSMGRKLKFLKRCFNRLAPLEPLKEEGLALCVRAGALASHRNNLIHGFISNYDAKTSCFTFTGLGSEKDVPLIKGQAQYAIHEVAQIGVDILMLGSDLANFLPRLVKTLMG